MVRVYLREGSTPPLLSITMSSYDKPPAYSKSFDNAQPAPVYFPREETFNNEGRPIYVVRTNGLIFNIFSLMVGLTAVVVPSVCLPGVLGYRSDEIFTVLFLILIAAGALQIGFSLACFSKEFLYNKNNTFIKAFFMQIPALFAVSFSISVAVTGLGAFGALFFLPFSLIIMIPYWMLMSKEDSFLHPYKRLIYGSRW